MLAPIQDLEWHDRLGKFIAMRWTNPMMGTGLRTPLRLEEAPRQDAMVAVVDYDIRFRRFQSIDTERDFDASTRILFNAKHMLSRDASAAADLRHTTGAEVCFLSLPFFPDVTPEADRGIRSQFRERESGHYAIRYRDAQAGWSPMSNVLYDSAAGAGGKHHVFDIRCPATGSASANLAKGFTLFEIRDPYESETRSYKVDLSGLAIGASVGLTVPASDGWTRFHTRSHLHLKDFDGLGVHVLSQGIVIRKGYCRTEVMFYDSLRDALIQNRDALAAGPVTLDGFAEGFELNALSKMVGTLVQTA